MATDARGHTAPAAAEAPRRQAFNDLSLSVNDMVMATNATTRGTVLTAVGSSAARPLFVYQQDTDTVWRHDGSAWRLMSNTPSSFQKSGVSTPGINNPAANVNGIDGILIKTGQLTAFTTVSFGSEYMVPVTYTAAFPTAALTVHLLQVSDTGTLPFAGGVAVDQLSTTGHRVLYVAGSAATKRSYVWTAVGY